MKMKIISILVFVIFAFKLQAQTKRIAHKSHSGSDANFALGNYFDNLGDPPMLFIDKIEKLTDTTALQYCSRFRGSYARKDTIKYYEDFFETDSVKVLNDTMAVKFSSGFLKNIKKTDTIVSDKKHLNHIILRGETYNPYVIQNYKNVDFVGFKDTLNEITDSSQKKEIIPVTNHSPNNKEKEYNKNALKNFIYLSFAVIGLSIMSFVLVLKRKRYA